ncbi:MAG: ribosomal protein S18-alanine N-acetyltransferase [Bacteroidota bacterium]
MKYEIRRMREADMSAVHAIDHASFSLPWPERSFRFEVTSNPAARCWVAEMDGQVVALLVIWMIVDEAHIATIATHPDFRRQGIGEELLSHALRQAVEEGAVRAFLEVRAGNEPARIMYRRMGFTEDGRRLHYYKDNGEDAILMSVDLKQGYPLERSQDEP